MNELKISAAYFFCWHLDWTAKESLEIVEELDRFDLFHYATLGKIYFKKSIDNLKRVINDNPSASNPRFSEIRHQI